MKHTYNQFQNVGFQLQTVSPSSMLYIAIVADAAEVCEKSSANLIKVGILRVCWGAGVMLCFFTVAYRFTLISPVITHMHTQTDARQWSI